MPSSQLARATAELHQARDTILAYSKEVAKSTQLKKSIMGMKYIVGFFQSIEKGLNSELTT